MERGQLPEYLSEKMTKKSSGNKRVMRSDDDYNLPHYKKKISQESLFYKGAKLFNLFKRDYAKTDEKFHMFIIDFVKNM